MKLEEYGFKIRSVGLRKLSVSGRIQKKEKNYLQTNHNSRRLQEQNDEYKVKEGKLIIYDEAAERENNRSMHHIICPIQLNNKNEQCQKLVQIGNNQVKNKETLIEKRDLFRDITHMLGSQNKILEEVQREGETKQHNGPDKEEQREQDCENILKSLKNQKQNSVLPVQTQLESNCISQTNQCNASHDQSASETNSILPKNSVVVIVENNNAQKYQKFDFAATNTLEQEQIQHQAQSSTISPTEQGNNEKPLCCLTLTTTLISLDRPVPLLQKTQKILSKRLLTFSTQTGSYWKLAVLIIKLNLRF